MSSITEQLRQAADCAPLWSGILETAASEIERLQSASIKRENKLKAEVVREAFLDGAACFGVMQSTAIEAYETSDTKIKLERGE